MNVYRLISLLFILFFLTTCEHKITIKKHKLTGINPVAYTDVIFKSNHDTVLTATFNGNIYEIIHNEEENRKQIAHIDDEIYSLAFNFGTNEIYAATLNSGIVVINALNGKPIRKLPVKQTWAYQICYNQQNGILATFDFKGNPYVWNTKANFKTVSTPKELDQMRPKYIDDNGDIYFDGNRKIAIWNYKTNSLKIKQTDGKIADVSGDTLLLIIGKEFASYSKKKDSIYFKKKHPNWPIHLAGKDSIVNIPLNLEIITGLMTKKCIYTCGLDKSIRKWDKSSGNLINTYSRHRGTPSGMAISEEESQLVTVDLLGKIHFWDLR